MASIEGIQIKNFRALKDITLGTFWSTPEAAPLSPLTAVIGKNGVGKSSLFDAFGFLADCLKLGVEEACDGKERGGFERLRSQGQTEPIEFYVHYKQDPKARPISYGLAIDLDESHRPWVRSEFLVEHADDQKGYLFLLLENGKGLAWEGYEVGRQFDISENILDVVKRQLFSGVEDDGDRITVDLSDNRKLGIATLGSLRQHPRISDFREFLEGWYLSYFTPDAARGLPLAGPQRHLSIHGENLGNVVQFIEREHRNKFDDILKRISEKIPGIDKIDTHQTPDGRLLLRFNDKGFDDPFYAQQMSDGTLKVFAYLLLLEDPSPPPFLCIEEPENGLYHKLLETLAAEFRSHATGKEGSSQIFLTTHQPYLVDALEPEEVWILEKGGDGFSTIRRASDDELLNNMVAEGLPLGGLWYSDYLDARV